jgi:hypothetical protein
VEPKFIIWQANLWDRFAKISPIIIALSIGIFYYLGYRDWSLVLNVASAVLFSVGVAWWFWVVYTIAIISMALNNSDKKLIDILEEIRQAQRELHELRPRDRQRRE